MDRAAGRMIKNETLHALLADGATVLLHFAEVHDSFVATASGATDHAAEPPPAAFATPIDPGAFREARHASRRSTSSSTTIKPVRAMTGLSTTLLPASRCPALTARRWLEWTLAVQTTRPAASDPR
jgi:hypothetical protein